VLFPAVGILKEKRTPNVSSIIRALGWRYSQQLIEHDSSTKDNIVISAILSPENP